MASVNVDIHLKSGDDFITGTTNGTPYLYADCFGISIYFGGSTLDTVIERLNELKKSMPVEINEEMEVIEYASAAAS